MARQKFHPPGRKSTNAHSQISCVQQVLNLMVIRFPEQESNCSFIVHTTKYLQLYCDIVYENLLTLFEA